MLFTEMKETTTRTEQLTEVTIREIIPVAADVKTFILEPDQPIPFEAGQFLTFLFREENGEERRSYSLMNSPAVDEPMAITVKRVANGRYSRPLIDKAVPGDRLLTTGATGQFVLPPDLSKYKQVFFFAAGIGITPVFSIIKTLLHWHPEQEVILIYSNSSQQKAVFYEELLALHKQFPDRFRLELLFSSTPDLTRARLSKWLLPQLLEVYANCAPEEQLFYTCGPFAYMRMVLITLEEAGYRRDQVKRELFDTSMGTRPIQPPDKELHRVTMHLGDRETTFGVQYPQTILRAARSTGIALPFSCETGRCGACAMQCVSGKVWMSYNEVLTEKDVAEGKVLTCVGYPVGGDVVLR